MLAAQSQPFTSMASHRFQPSHPYGLSTAYAIPAPRSHGRGRGSETEGLSYAEHELLRSRKTPHGRIDEYHDADYLDPNVHVPASKHVLLSISPQSSNQRLLYYQPRYRSVQQPHAIIDDENWQSGGRINDLNHSQMTANGPQPMWDYVGGVDSATQHNIMVNDQRIFYHPDYQIPTVLPALLQSHIGPTASAAQQHFGPYWPDGTFSPYCPAPIRDNRFFGPNHTPPAARLVSVSNGRTLRRPGRLPNNDHNLVHSRVPLPSHEANQAYLPFCERVFSSGTKKDRLRHNKYNEVIHSEPYQTSLPLDSVRAVQTVTGHRQKLFNICEASENIAFRDRTFSWAHQVYVDLLTRIQRDHKPGRPTISTHGHTKSTPTPVIFPRPPQRTGSYFKDPSCGLGKSPTQSDLIQTRALGFSATHSERPRTAIHSSQHTASERYICFNPTTTQPADHAKRTRSDEWVGARCGSDPNMYQNSNQSQLPLLSPPFVAMSALETMELLCEEADTPWTDGMLLAGCLAYGLGNYLKASNWYRKILAQDPHHVEALSNLAATLLAVGNRDEALLNWSVAVKLRPSYFEAVEHLIGLLCTANRAKEAVDMIEYVESCLKISKIEDINSGNEANSDGESDTLSRSSSTTTVSRENGVFDYDMERRVSMDSDGTSQQAAGFGSSGYSVSGADNGRLLALIHAKGNMLYGLGNNTAAAAAFEDAILIATGHRHSGIRGLIQKILQSCVSHVDQYPPSILRRESKEPILLSPERAQQTAQRMFPPNGELPGLEFVPKGLAQKAAISTTSNSLLSLAKIYQDGLSRFGNAASGRANGTREILALYYLSLSLQRSPSTANNVGILLASVQQTTNIQVVPKCANNQIINYAGILPGSGIALALQYYNYGLNIDPKHAHLYTNLGSLLKDLGQLNSAIKMYEIAVQCDGNFDIALANLANAVKDQGRIADAITYYRRAVQANPDFAEAVCGLATALNSVCNWYGRGGVYADSGMRDRVHVDEHGVMQEARRGCGWMNRVVEIVDRQLKDGESWGIGILTPSVIEQICRQLSVARTHLSGEIQQQFYQHLRSSLHDWSGKRWEGSRVVRLVERSIRQIGWQWYQDRYREGKEYSPKRYARPILPLSLSSPTAPTVLPFHTFTTPLSAKQVRQISQRNALRISLSALRSPWLPMTVFPPPPPPNPYLKVGYVSSDFNNHPLAHLMQSIFGLHDTSSVRAYCYATTSSDGSAHRHQIEREAPVFYDASAWNVEKLVDQVVKDGIHILVNLNGYTRGARNEVFAARPAPIHMSFMGFAGTLGAEWCDYVFADAISVLPKTLSPGRSNVSIEDRLRPEALVEDEENWIYAENVIFAKSTFFCVDHKQSAPDAKTGRPTVHDQAGKDRAWKIEQDNRWRLRKELFPTLSDSAIILGNFNQLYKIDPSTFRMYLRILRDVPNAILWLLRFPDVGEQNLRSFAREWGGEEVASRVIFTDVAPKGAHITRASVVDLFLDTPECNAHTTAADVIWSGTPIVTWARWDYKMCSRMASSIVASALPEGVQGTQARKELLVNSDEEYEKHAISLASGLQYPSSSVGGGRGQGRLMELRRVLWEGRWTSRLFDTRRWVADLEKAYWQAWLKWENGEGGDIWL